MAGTDGPKRRNRNLQHLAVCEGCGLGDIITGALNGTKDLKVINAGYFVL